MQILARHAKNKQNL